jgi:hypothetical protein
MPSHLTAYHGFSNLFYICSHFQKLTQASVTDIVVRRIVAAVAYCVSEVIEETNVKLVGTFDSKQVLALTEDQRTIVTNARGAYFVSTCYTSIVNIKDSGLRHAGIQKAHSFLMDAGAPGTAFFQKLPDVFKKKVSPMLE